MWAETLEALICLCWLPLDCLLGSSKQNDCFGCEMNCPHESFFLAAMSDWASCRFTPLLFNNSKTMPFARRGGSHLFFLTLNRGSICDTLSQYYNFPYQISNTFKSTLFDFEILTVYFFFQHNFSNITRGTFTESMSLLGQFAKLL